MAGFHQAAYAVTAVTLGAPLRSGLATALRHLLIANLFGMVAGYSMERYIRRDFLLTRLLAAEQRKSEGLLASILPGPVIERLKEKSGTIADSFAEVTVLFADIVEFTPLCSRLSPGALVELLTAVFATMNRLAEKHGLETIKTTGDAYMAVGGLPLPRLDHAEAMAEFALDVREAIARLGAERGHRLALRIGINTGPVVAGVIGTRRFIYDLWGDLPSPQRPHRRPPPAPGFRGIDGHLRHADVTLTFHLLPRPHRPRRGSPGRCQ